MALVFSQKHSFTKKTSLGCIFDQFRLHFSTILASIFGVFSASFFISVLASILDDFWTHFGTQKGPKTDPEMEQNAHGTRSVILGRFWTDLGSILGRLGSHFGSFSGPISDLGRPATATVAQVPKQRDLPCFVCYALLSSQQGCEGKGHMQQRNVDFQKKCAFRPPLAA